MNNKDFWIKHGKLEDDESDKIYVNLNEVKSFVYYSYKDYDSIIFYMDGKHYHTFYYRGEQKKETKEFVEFLENYFNIKSLKDCLNEYKNNLNYG